MHILQERVNDPFILCLIQVKLCILWGTLYDVTVHFLVFLKASDQNDCTLSSVDINLLCVVDEGTVCGGLVSDNVGFIVPLDSDADGMYDLNTDCLWLFHPRDGYKVRYKIESYNLELSDYCSKDFLRVSLDI